MEGFSVPDDISGLNDGNGRIHSLPGFFDRGKLEELGELIAGSVARLHEALFIIGEAMAQNIPADDMIGFKGKPVAVLHLHVGPLEVELAAQIDLKNDGWELMISAKPLEEGEER